LSVNRRRADAVRNRAAILAAAAELFDRHDLASVSVQDIAQEAGVSKAAVFRHFGDRSGLIQEILEPRAAALREAVVSGPAPLGPGAQPADALAAYIDALFDFVCRNRVLIRAFEYLGSDAYYTNAASEFWIAELDRRLTAVDPELDAGYLAHALFTALRADVLDYLRTVPGMTQERIRAGIHTLAASRHPQHRSHPGEAPTGPADLSTRRRRSPRQEGH
jgi:AcrR family transcriptional regulator